MGMPITVEVVDQYTKIDVFEKVFSYFEYIDNKFSTYKKDSEISLINEGKIELLKASSDMKKVLNFAEETKKETHGYFDVYHDGRINPSGIVKGWAIYNAAKILIKHGFSNFYIEAGGDIQVFGKNKLRKSWKAGIKSPFRRKKIVKILYLTNCGIATSGNYERGMHIYNPLNKKRADEIASMTVVGPNVYEADRFATAAFAMGKKGIGFIEKQKNLEGYMINKQGQVTFTSGFEKLTNGHN